MKVYGFQDVPMKVSLLLSGNILKAGTLYTPTDTSGGAIQHLGVDRPTDDYYVNMYATEDYLMFNYVIKY